MPPGTTAPSTGGAGNISGKFSEMTRCCCSLARLQIVAAWTSWELAKEKYTLPGLFLLEEVEDAVLAGVLAGDERRPRRRRQRRHDRAQHARACRARISSPRNGITPASM